MIRQDNMIYILLIASASLMLLTGCYTNFEPDLESTPVVCLNSQITAGEKIKAEVTRTWRYSEGSPAVNLDIELLNATVSLYVNDEFKENLILKSDTSFYTVYNYFEAQYIPESGDWIRLIASDKTYGEAEAEVIVPFPVEINHVETEVTQNKSSYDAEEEKFESKFEMIIKVNLTDPASVSNYYIFDMKTRNYILYDSDAWSFVPIAESVTLKPDYGYDPIFSEHITPIETIITDAYGLYTVFSDRQISGKPYTLEIPVSGSYLYDYRNHPDPNNKLTIDLNLGHISTAYYNYILSLWAATEGVSGALGDVGLGDAVFEFSNVSTGAGIVTTRANSTVKLNIYDILTSKE